MPNYDDYVPAPAGRLLEIIGTTLIIVVVLPLIVLADLVKVSGSRHPTSEDREPSQSRAE
jgi:hypothetical protein